MLSVITCQTLTDPVNGDVFMTGNNIGDTATFTCDYGYRLDGPVTLTCLGDGSWDLAVPRCQGNNNNSSFTAKFESLIG